MAYTKYMARGRGDMNIVGARESEQLQYRDEFNLLVDEGYSTRQLAKHFNKGQTTIRYWLEKFDIKTNVPSIRSIPYQGDKIILECPAHGQAPFTWSKSENTYRCQECWKSFNKRARHKAKEQAILEAGGKCERCGYHKSQRALQFHHIDPSQKSANLSRIYTLSAERRKQELAKCILLCANCHHIEEAKVKRELHKDNAKGEKQKQKRFERKAKLVELKGGKCLHCSYSESVDAFHFHHVIPAAKNFEVNGANFNRKWETLVQEIDQCILLCANCHTEEHARKDLAESEIKY